MEMEFAWKKCGAGCPVITLAGAAEMTVHLLID